VEERWSGVRALVEWVAAAAAVALLLWAVSAPFNRVVGRGVQAVTGVELPHAPPGVPAGATMVPVLLLADGREVRQGDLRSQVDELLPPELAEGPPVVTQAPFGDRHTRAFRINGSQVFVVCEQSDDGAMRVSGIYLP
jgi:hypothetical protein